MTEFEKSISELIDEIDGDWAVFMTNPGDYIERFAPKILEAARKQIASEVDADAMCFKFANDKLINHIDKVDAYRKGIEDTLKAISGSGE